MDGRLETAHAEIESGHDQMDINIVGGGGAGLQDASRSR
jgi:hypothetical protein